MSDLEWTDVGGSWARFTSVDVPAPLLAAISIGDQGACRAMAYLDDAQVRAAIAWLTERLEGVA